MSDAEAYLALAGIDMPIVRALGGIGYFTQPANKGHHLACDRGLAQHSVNVSRRLAELTKTLKVEWLRAEAAPYVVGMLHDLVKCRCYRMIGPDAAGRPQWQYVQPEFPGHGSCSVMLAVGFGVSLYPDEIAAITYHMGTFGIGKEYTENEFDAAMKLYAPQIIATHTADWYACRVDEESEVEG